VGVPVREFLVARRNRALGSIMGHAERELFPDLPPEKCEAFRTLVRDSINGYHDSILDLVKAEDGVRNDEVVAVLERLERRLPRRAGVSPLQTGVDS
jgi:hypothetical protein